MIIYLIFRGDGATRICSFFVESFYNLDEHIHSTSDRLHSTTEFLTDFILIQRLTLRLEFVCFVFHISNAIFHFLDPLNFLTSSCLLFMALGFVEQYYIIEKVHRLVKKNLIFYSSI